ncbi:sodium/potassium/calcium exchanger [Holotrichia oblita]|uniref:Sodium/potassium/calcium exchanger n=2 Tax=Holotrichia oblita TaxID=644536 RepID=A0ACB9TGI1_HOLOL|nr:sodium/potassium/calcium exchanger [Holotrichia oblita]KAI4465896.1 sodium/potassium/calcium exchanger [Holotrichia oblita]
MLKIVFYFIISSLVLTYQQDIPRALARSTEIDEIADLESNCTQTSLEGNGCEISNDGSHKKRRTHIWFAVFRANDVPNVTEEECGSSADDFPSFLTLEQRSNGGIVIHILIAIYCFCLIAIVCDHYFIPCVEEICSTLQLSEDVAAATFMAVATSAPELFVNVIGTFLLDSDIGIGTIVGSSMFNTIGVAAIGGLAAPYPIKIAWWPVTRDISLYICAIIMLVCITWDGFIYWYEAVVLCCGYIVYFIVMVMNKKIADCVFKLADYINKRRSVGTSTETPSKPISIISSFRSDGPRMTYIEANNTLLEKQISVTDFESGETFNIPDAVLGMTFLGVGGCLPESFSIAILSRKGEGKMGVSNALGANTMNILLSLGMPWFIKTLMMGAKDDSYIQIQSGSLEYTILGLIAVAATLYISLVFTKFHLSKASGLIKLTCYCGFLALAILADMVFFPGNCI